MADPTPIDQDPREARRERYQSQRERGAANVRRVMDEKGMSRRQLSFDSGLDRAFLLRFERDAGNISIDALFALAEALEVDVREFFRDQSAE